MLHSTASRWHSVRQGGSLLQATDSLHGSPSSRPPALCHRKERLLRLRRHLHEVLLDQLPLLRDLQRVLDEAADRKSVV